MIAVTGGGTGGHLAVARAVNEVLHQRGEPTLFIGSVNGQDRAWFGEDPSFSSKHFLEVGGVMNKGGLGKIAALWRVAKAAAKTVGILRRNKVQALFSVGGYSAAPACFAALLLGIPVVIHEQNAVIGSLNRLIRPFAKGFFSSFHPGSPSPDYPVAAHFFQTARTRTTVETVIFLGGSQGAAAINRLALELAPELKKRGISVIHQTGKNEYETVKEGYETLGAEAEVFPFAPDLHEKITRADFAVARSGAGTLFELAAARIPAFFIPYPYAAGDHQYANAMALAEKGLGWCARQETATAAMVLDAMDGNLEKISAGLAEVVAPDGAAKIADFLASAKRG